MRRSLPALLVILAALVPAANAAAQSTTPGGVTVDPNSPSGTEYDIPVQKARRDAQGTKKSKQQKSDATQTSTSTSSTDSAPLFGEGVRPDTTTSSTTTPPTTTAPSTPAKPKTTERHKDRKSSTTTTPVPSTETTMSSPAPSEQLPPPAEVRDAQLAAKTAAADNGPTPALAVGAGAVVLLLAGLSGWWLRRRSG